MLGRVVALHRWPVKSMGGQPVQSLAIDRRGAEGDRAHAVYDEFRGHPRRLTARESPRLLLWHAVYDDDGAVVVTGPDGRRFAWDDKLAAALSADLGRPVWLKHDEGLMQDLRDSLLVTFAASHRALEAELGPLDERRWRTNIAVEADAPPFAEAAWEGRELRVGEARLEVLHPCERCVIPTRDPDTAEKRPELLRHLAARHETLFGVNARTAGPARIAVGDVVEL